MTFYILIEVMCDAVIKCKHASAFEELSKACQGVYGEKVSTEEKMFTVTWKESSTIYQSLLNAYPTSPARHSLLLLSNYLPAA